MRDLITLVEAASLEGTLDVRALAKMLDVEHPALFASAFVKVKYGHEERLTRLETQQLSQAFISLLKGDREEKTRILRKLMQVHEID